MIKSVDSRHGLAPVVLFVCARPDHTERTLNALASNRLASETDLVVYADAPKHAGHAANVAAVRELIRRYGARFRTVVIHEQPVNLGLAKSVIAGVSEIVEKFDHAIVVEDDPETSPSFLQYMNDALNAYQDDPTIFSISGYTLPAALLNYPKDFSHDVCLIPRHCSWGWAIWNDRWRDIDWEVQVYKRFKQDAAARRQFNAGVSGLSASLDLQMRGAVDSWAIRCAYAGVRRGQYTVYPRVSFVDNIGLDGTGVRCGETPEFRNDLRVALSTWILPPAPLPDRHVVRAFATACQVRWARTVVELCKSVMQTFRLLSFVLPSSRRAAA